VEILEVASLQKVFKEQEEERQDNGAASLIQKDSAGISYVKVSREEAFHFDEIRLKTGSVKYFNRKIDLYIPDMPEHSNSNPGRLLKSWTISNNNTLILQAGQNCNAKVFYLLIHNDDNLPLKVLAVNTTTEYKYLVSYLDSGQHYRLVLGNPGATNPQYDLDALKNAFETTIPALGFGKLIRVDEPPVIKAADPKNNKWMLWLVIGVVLVVLLIFTGKMIKEISKRKQDDHL
jgi:hypothetical protein